MSIQQSVLSWIFYLVFVVFTYAGLFAFKLDHKSSKTKLLTGAFSALAIWALCFSVANAAPDHATALFWRQAASIGWGTLYSFVLHLSLVTAGHGPLLKRHRWLPWLIYLPAALNVYGFLLAPGASQQLHIVAYRFGWNSIWVDSFWNWFHAVYFGLFSGLSVMLLLRWLFKTKDKGQKHQALSITYSFLAAGVLGAITDLLRLTHSDVMLPQLGILLVLIPTVNFFHLIRQHAFIESVQIVKSEGIGQILNDNAREKLYGRIGHIVYAMSFVNFANYAFVLRDYSPVGLLLKGLLYSLMLLLSGEMIINARRFRQSVKMQEWMLSITVSVMLLAGIAAYADRGAITIWTLVFPMIVVSVMLSNPRVMGLLVLTQVAAQLVLYLVFGFRQVLVQPIDYLVRTLSIVFSMFLAYYVNRVYLARLRDNEDAIRFQTALVDMSWSLRSFSLMTIDEAMQDAVNDIARYLPARRVIQMMVQEGSVWHARLSQLPGGGQPEKADHAAITAVYQAYFDENDFSEQGERYQVYRRDLPADSQLYRYLSDQDISMIVFTPFMLRKKTADWLILEFTSDEDCCHPRFNEYLRIVTQYLSNYMLRTVAEYDLRYLAYHDQLTGLHNRTHFLEEADVRLRERQDSPHALIFVDVDAFKDINDTAGHDTGNRVISAVAQRLQSVTQQQDLLARFGGDEFILMADLSGRQGAAQVAEDLLTALRDPVRVDAWEFNVTASMGIALYPDDGHSAKELLNNADFAMYEAKNSGKNRYCFYVPDHKSKAHTNYVLRNSLGRAIDQGELDVFYQPQVSLTDERIVGVEALVRWQHPSLGRIPPAAFIPIAEETGQIICIGYYVLDEACKRVAALNQGLETPLRLGLNFSYQQLMAPDLPDRLARALENSGLAPSCLEIEITESTTGKYGDELAQVIQLLRQMGLSLAIGDYGADYSGLGRLSHFAIDRIKIDKSLIDRIDIKGDADTSQGRNRVIIENIITLARELGASVIAEGVETAQQVAYLKNLHCDEVQGYHYHRPMPAAELERLMAGA